MKKEKNMLRDLHVSFSNRKAQDLFPHHCQFGKVKRRVKILLVILKLWLDYFLSLTWMFECILISTLQVATILVIMATRILELATKLERKSPAWQLKLTWPMRQELEQNIIRSEKKNILSIKNSLCKASCCGILTNRNGDWITWNVTR